MSTGVPSEAEQPLYWKNNFFLKLLRFFNLLEPGRPVLSLSKLLVWVNIVIMIFVMIFQTEQIVAVIGASVAASASMLNYAYRRFINHKNDALVINTLPQEPPSPPGLIDER